jgi:hypothetical protein
MSDVNFKQMMEKQDCELYQLALIALARKNPSLVLSRAEIMEAYKYVGEVDEINGKFVFRAKLKPTNFDQQKAQEFFDAARAATPLS